MENTRLPERVESWLKYRGISEHIIRTRIGWDGTHIVIPVFGENGALLFNKYRKDPFDESDAPKYQYQKGATAALYGIDQPLDKVVYLCEGELDAMRLMSNGYSALSTTGGSGTFLPEWAAYLEGKEVIVCYDNDEPGIKGAIRVQARIPSARILLLPRGPWKDVTEYLNQNSAEKFENLASFACSYFMPKEADGPVEGKKQIKEMVEAFKAATDACMKARRDANMGLRPDFEILEQLNRHLMSRLDHYKHVLKSFDRTGVKDGTKVQQARQVSILNYLQFNRQGFGKCLWHEDSSPSLFYNKPSSKMPNTVKCFSCGFHGDVIDVVMKLKLYTFLEAVNELVP